MRKCIVFIGFICEQLKSTIQRHLSERVCVCILRGLGYGSGNWAEGVGFIDIGWMALTPASVEVNSHPVCHSLCLNPDLPDLWFLAPAAISLPSRSPVAVSRGVKIEQVLRFIQNIERLLTPVRPGTPTVCSYADCHCSEGIPWHSLIKINTILFSCLGLPLLMWFSLCRCISFSPVPGKH